MAKFTTLPKVDLPAGATPSEVNQYYAKDATQANTEILTQITDTGIVATDSDTSQVSKAVSRYSMANLFVEGAGSNHSGSSDLYIAVRPSATVTTSMKIPTTFIEGSFVFKAAAMNQSQNVLFQLSTNSAVSLKKYNINNQLIDLDIGEIKADDIVIIHLDLANNTAILKRAGSAEELAGLVGKFNINDQLDFTTSAPVAGSIGDIYINTVTGTISSGFVGSGSSTSVTANKLYQLYDDGATFRWYEIDAVAGMLVFDETANGLLVYDGTSWDVQSIVDATPTVKGIDYLSGLQKVDEAIISNNATVEFINLDDGYSHLFLLENIVAVSNSVNLFARISDDNGSSWESGAGDYKYTIRSHPTIGSIASQISDSTSAIQLTDSTFIIGNSVGRNLFGKIDLQNPASTTRYSTIISDFSYFDDSGTFVRNFGGSGYNIVVTAINGIQFYVSSGNLDTGIIKHYKYK